MTNAMCSDFMASCCNQLDAVGIVFCDQAGIKRLHGCYAVATGPEFSAGRPLGHIGLRQRIQISRHLSRIVPPGVSASRSDVRRDGDGGACARPTWQKCNRNTINMRMLGTRDDGIRAASQRIEQRPVRQMREGWQTATIKCSFKASKPYRNNSLHPPTLIGNLRRRLSLCLRCLQNRLSPRHCPPSHFIRIGLSLLGERLQILFQRFAFLGLFRQFRLPF